MAAEFDPYYKWLGIHPKDQPPHHYRLLSVELFESDVEVIEAAADRHIAYLQDVAAGPHVRQSQKILNEIAVARLCLLDPQKKAAYDTELKKRLAGGSNRSADESAPPVAPPPPPPAPDFEEPPAIETAGHIGGKAAPTPASHAKRSSIRPSNPRAGRQPLGPVAKLVLFVVVVGTVVVGCTLIVLLLLTAPRKNPQTDDAADVGVVGQADPTTIAPPNASEDEVQGPNETLESRGGIELRDWGSVEPAVPSPAGRDLVAHYTFEPPDSQESHESGGFDSPFAGAAWVEGTQPDTRALALNGGAAPLTIPCPVRGDFTIAFWLKATKRGGRGTKWNEGIGIVTARGESRMDSYFGISLIEDRVAFGMGINHTTVKSKQAVSDGQWYHVAVVHLSSSGRIRLYVDADLQYSATAVIEPAPVAASITLGREEADSDRFEGALDDLRFYNLALEKGQIRAIMSQTRPPGK